MGVRRAVRGCADWNYGHLFFSLKILGAIGYLALIAVAVTAVVEGMRKR